MTDRDKGASQAPEWPTFTERHWYAASISLVIIGLVLAGFGTGWVLSAVDAVEMKTRTELITPFATIFLAVITFCTVAWRGMVTARQADQQRRQNDAKDEENVAKLLMDGTKLLGEDKESHIFAGIAALQAVVVSPTGVFSSQAMDILVDLIEATYRDPTKMKMFEAAMAAVEEGARRNRQSTRTLVLDYTGVNVNYAPAINGIRRVAYKFAVIEPFEYDRFLNIESISFSNRRIQYCTIKGYSRNFFKCTFEDCSFEEITTRLIGQNDFEDCDFSGAAFKGSFPKSPNGKPHPFEKLLATNSYFNADNPPQSTGKVDWSRFLRRNEFADFINDEGEEAISAA